MTNNAYDVTVIGAGIVGLATARELLQRQPGLRVAVVERETTIAFHQSGRNSGVIHAGLYYTPGSLRSRLCREGRELLIRFAEENEIPYRLTGKLVVAVSDEELPNLHALNERGPAFFPPCELAPGAVEFAVAGQHPDRPTRRHRSEQADEQLMRVGGKDDRLGSAGAKLRGYLDCCGPWCAGDQQFASQRHARDDRWQRHQSWRNRL